MKIVSQYFRYRFLLLNLIFGVYLIWLQPVVLERLDVAVNKDIPDFFLGGLLLGIQLIEIIGLMIKRPIHAYWAKMYPSDDLANGFWSNMNVVGLILSPILHMALSALLGIFAFDLLNTNSKSQVPFILGICPVILVFIIIAKEAVFTVLVLSMGAQNSLFKEPAQSNAESFLRRLFDPAPLTEITLHDVFKDFLGDLMLLVFSGLTYTTCWEFLIRNNAINPSSSEVFFEYLGLSILFLLVFISNRIIYLVQEISTKQSRSARAISLLSFLLVWIIAMWTIPTN